MITSKLPNTSLNTFSVMARIAKDFNAIDLSRGFADYNCSPRLIELVYQYMKNGFNQYAPMPGVLELRKHISAKIKADYGHEYDPQDEITITAGAMQTISTAISAFVKENEEVIILEPSYDSYTALVKLNGGVPVYVKLTLPDFKIDWTELNGAITARTRMIIINNPHRPTGAIFAKEDMEKLVKLVNSSKIMILSDEVFEHIIYDQAKHQSISSFPELANKSIVVSSFGKSFNVNGWNISYCTGPAEYMNEFRKIHQYQVFSANSPIQYAFAEFIQNHDEYEKIAPFYQNKRDLFLKLLKTTKFQLIPTKSTYYQLVDYSAISDEKDQAFATRLITDFGIAGIPLSAFYHDKIEARLVRFCFAKNDDTLQGAVEQLAKL